MDNGSVLIGIRLVLWERLRDDFDDPIVFEISDLIVSVTRNLVMLVGNMCRDLMAV